METKPLAFGIIGFLIGGLVVSVAAIQPDEPDDTAPGPEMTMSQMTNSLKDKTGDDFDKAFIAAMIEHHQGAIAMATLAKKNAKHDEIKNMSDGIVMAQSKEINMMKNWQTWWGYEGTATGHDSMGH